MQTAAPVHTPIGSMMLISSDGMPVRMTDEMNIPITPPSKRVADVLHRLSECFAGTREKVLSDDEIHEYLDGRVSDFQMGVLSAINEIPRGQTRTYRQIAQALHNPGAVRAVGSACAKNPLPLVIPCHRVVPAQGLGKYSGPGGIDSKRLLLEQEGAL